MFIELALGEAGPTPVAFVAAPSGRILRLRVALPEPDNRRAERDLEDMVIRKIPRIPHLAGIVEASKVRFASAASGVWNRPNAEHRQERRDRRGK